MATFDEVAAVAVATQNHNMGKNPTSSIKEINALLNRITGDKKTKVVDVNGGMDIDSAVALSENQSVQNYYGSQMLSVPRSQPFARVKQGWAQKAMFIVAHGREVRQNMSDAKLFDYVDELLDNARDTAANRMAVEVRSDGALGESISGVQSFITANGGGEYGGIDSTIYPKWRNQVQAMPSVMAGTDLENAIDKLFIKCVDGADKPDLLMLPVDWYTMLEAQIRDRTRYDGGYAKKSDLDLGFTTLKYKNGMDVVWDENSQYGANVTRGYMMTTKRIKFFEHKDARWKFDEGQRPVNQDTLVMFAPWQGGMITTKRRVHGLLTKAA
jgi:hypothetical protein